MKQKLLKIAALAATLVGGLELLGNIAAWAAVKYLAATASRGEAAAIGVIGGADGPTAIFVTGVSTNSALTSWLLPAALLAVGIWGLVHLKKCNK